MKTLTKFLAVFLLALLGANLQPAWADDNTVVGVAANNSNDYTMKLNVNRKGDGDDWQNKEMSKAGLTFEGKKVYITSYEVKYSGLGKMQFQLYNESTWQEQKEPISSWATDIHSNEIFNYDDSSWYSKLTMYKPRVYFNANGWSQTSIKVVVGHANYQAYYSLSKITNTNLYFGYLTSMDWGDAMGFGVVGGTSASDNTNWLTNVSAKAEEYTGFLHYGLNQYKSDDVDAMYYVTHTGKGEKPTCAYHANYSDLNKTQTVKVMVKAAGGSYTEKTYGSWPATIKAKRYKLNSNGASQADETDADLTSATFTSVITSAAKIYVPTPNTGYTFKGWGTSSSDTPSNASSDYEYTVADETTIYLFFDENTYSVTAAQGTGCASVSPSGAQTVGQLTGKQFVATGSTGYHFVNWTSSNGGTFTAPNNETTTFKPTAAATITANYAENTYTVTATYGEGGASASVTTSPAGQVTGTAINATAASGYIFSGWTITSGTGSFADAKSASTTYYPTLASELKATFARSTVTVNSGISSNHATLSGVSKSHTVTIGTDTNVPGDEDVTFTVSNLDNGYKIEGWYTNSGYTDGKHDEGVNTYVLSSTNPNKNVYVKITPITYTITYNENGGTEQTDGTYTIESAEITLPTSNEITRTNYTFLGWFANSDFTGDAVKTIPTGSTGDKEYWAKWEETKYAVTLEGAQSPESPVQVGNVTAVQIVANTPTPGYYFVNWTKTGSVTIADANSATTTINATGEGTVTANFAERFYLRGSSTDNEETKKGMPGWGDDAKDSGKGRFTSINGNIATITKNLEAETEYKLKLGDMTGNSWGGDHEFTNDADLWTFTCNAENDCAAPTFRTSIAGDYTFTIDFSEASPKMKITYPAVSDFTLTVAEARVYEETPMANFIAGNGTEESPYQFYLDEKMTLTATALTEIAGVTAYYKFGDGAESSSVLTKDITVNNTALQSIVVKTYYKGNIGSYTSAEKTKTIWYQGVAVPALHLQSSLTKDEVELSLAPNDVTIFYTTENYTGAATITKNNVSWQSVESGEQWQQTETLNKTIHSDTYVATATPNERTFTATLAVSVYRYVQVKVKDANPKWASHLYMWNSVSGKKNAEWPGEALTTQLGDWYIFAVKYPTYDKFVVNDGKTTGKQTIDLDIPEEDICYQIGAEQSETDGKHIYACATGDCPNGLYVGDIADVAMYSGESATASPVVQLDPTLDEKNLQIAFSYSNSGIVTATQSGKKIMLSANQAGTTTVTATYSIAGAENVVKIFNVTVKGAVMIQAKYGDLGWSDHNEINIHYWGTGVDTTQKMTWKDYVSNQDRVYARIPLGSDNKINFQIYAWDMDDKNQWHITKDVTNVTESGCYEITPGESGQKRNINRTGDYCWADYQVKIVMNNGTVYTSNTIGDISETLSFFAPGENATGYNRGDVYLMCNGSQKAVIPSSTFATSGVYTAKTDGSTLTDVALYTGDYYIRTDGASGGWDHYKEADKDNKFVKFDAIETSTYDHYWVKNIKQNSLNLQACVGNDYNENLANKIVASNYTDENGSVTPDDKGVNLRFGYSPLTNNFERAIIKGSSTNDFLNVIGNNVYKERECTTLLNTQSEDSKFADKEQWIYEKTVYVKIDGTHISANAKLQSKAYNNQVMYQLGYEIDPITGHETATPKTFGLIAAGTTNGTYAIKLIYDFKTNRMVSGWSPSEDPIDGTIVLDADMLLVRNHQNSAAQIKFANNSSAIQQIHHIYGVMQIEKATMKNADISTYARHLYWISFPFDVKISSIFGVGTYGVEWKLQRYDGEERATKGWFKGDGTTTFWKNMTTADTLHAYEGYILNLKPSEFDNDECAVWNNSRTVATFYFPSVDGNVGIIQKESYQQSVPMHECKIDREFEMDGNIVNHMNTDSHWNVIGVPAFEDATVSATPTSENFKSYYAWNASENKYDAEVAIGGATVFNAMHAYMVQFYGTIDWTNVSVVTTNNAPYRYADEKNYLIQLFFSNSETEDKTFVKLADKASTDFVLNEDMMKIDNAGYPNIYSFAGSYNVAYNETKMDNQTVTLGVSAPKAGTYTFSMPKEFSGTAKLIDLVEGITTDLNVSNYSVDLNKGTYNDRFQLLLEVEAKAPTSIENVERGRWNVDGKTLKLLRNGNIYLINAGRVYNATGAEVR